MARTPTWALVYDPEVKGHLAAIETKHHGLIRTAIEEQLQFSPDAETRNRKPLRRPVEFGADWELRFGPDDRFRVFYAMDARRREVQVLAIGVLAVGVKEGSRLSIGGEEITI